MPTGFTHAVQAGEITDFPTFALQCARAMGALIMMRDEPISAPIPDRFEPSDFYARQLKDAQSRVRELESMPPDEIAREAEARYQTAIEVYREREHTRQVERERYDAMLAQVEAWEPPTSEHSGLKDFMLQQLRESIRFDCGYSPEEPKRVEPSEWYGQEMSRAKKNVERHEAEHQKEVERTEARNQWIAQLRESLSAFPASVEEVSRG